MKRLFLAIALTLATLWGAASAVVPQFSTDGDEHWYYLLFDKTELSMQVAPNDMPVTSAIFNGALDQQMWKLTGDAQSFTLTNKEGRVVSFRGKYFRNNKDALQAVALRLHELDGGLYEIEYPAKGDADCYMAATGKDKQIAPKAKGDAQCAVGFYPVTEVWADVAEYPVEGSTTYTPDHRHTLWYTLPVTAHTAGNTWMEYALPIGNGYFGAMVYGGVHRDQLQFNDKSAWTGSSTIRGCYQNFGDVIISDISGSFGETSPIKDYVRYLDLTEGVAGARYTSADGSVAYTREYLASNPDEVVAMRITASRPGQLSVAVSLKNQLKLLPWGYTYSGDKASFEGKLDLVDYKAAVKVVPVGGQMSATDGSINVTGADEIVIYLAGATNFDQHSDTYISDADAMRALVDTRLEAAVRKGWEAIRRDHIADHQAFYNRCELSFSGATNDIDTESLVKYYNESTTAGTDPRALMLEELYYSYGRYLLIGCSRTMDSPANLQGIWNNSNAPAWQCDIHSNINVQMNYWPAEITNLSELHMPYLNYIHSMAIEHKEWQEYARRSGMTKGWTCFTQNNIFGHSDYAENYVIANAWYTSHLWQHYRYTLDRDFLKGKALPVMLSCTDFWLERLTEAEDGTLVAPAE
ncbi:MAG: glycoside hydrolase family 95 protein, partial [Muribaculaceae bacterium]|nr:glycoside hydrolase family 95 protein [Muribaculaceae bacterium]